MGNNAHLAAFRSSRRPQHPVCRVPLRSQRRAPQHPVRPAPFRSFTPRRAAPSRRRVPPPPERYRQLVALFLKKAHKIESFIKNRATNEAEASVGLPIAGYAEGITPPHPARAAAFRPRSVRAAAASCLTGTPLPISYPIF